MVDPRNYKEIPFLIQYLFMDDPNQFIEFIEDVLDAKELRERHVVDNKVVNSLLEFAGSLFEISQARGQFKQVPHSFHIYTTQANAILTKAKAKNCEIKFEFDEMDYGDLESWFIDPFGNNWFIATPLNREA